MNKKFEDGLRAIGILTGCLVQHSPVEYVNPHVQWMYEQFIRAAILEAMGSPESCTQSAGGKVAWVVCVLLETPIGVYLGQKGVLGAVTDAVLLTKEDAQNIAAKYSAAEALHWSDALKIELELINEKG